MGGEGERTETDRKRDELVAFVHGSIFFGSHLKEQLGGKGAAAEARPERRPTFWTKPITWPSRRSK